VLGTDYSNTKWSEWEYCWLYNSLFDCKLCLEFLININKWIRDNSYQVSAQQSIQTDNQIIEMNN